MWYSLHYNVLMPLGRFNTRAEAEIVGQGRVVLSEEEAIAWAKDFYSEKDEA